MRADTLEALAGESLEVSAAPVAKLEVNRRAVAREEWARKLVDAAYEEILAETGPGSERYIRSLFATIGSRSRFVGDEKRFQSTGRPSAIATDTAFALFVRRAATFKNWTHRWPERVEVPFDEGNDTDDGLVERGKRISLGWLSLNGKVTGKLMVEYGQPTMLPSYSLELGQQSQRRTNAYEAVQEEREQKALLKLGLQEQDAIFNARLDAAKDLEAYRRCFKGLQRNENHELLLQLGAANNTLVDAETRLGYARRDPVQGRNVVAAQAEVARLQALLDQKMTREQQAALAQEQQAILEKKAGKGVAERKAARVAEAAKAEKRYKKAGTKINKKLEPQRIKLQAAEEARDRAYANGDSSRYNTVNEAVIRERNRTNSLMHKLELAEQARDQALNLYEVYCEERALALAEAGVLGIDQLPLSTRVKIAYVISRVTLRQSVQVVESMTHQLSDANKDAATAKIRLVAAQSVEIQAVLLGESATARLAAFSSKRALSSEARARGHVATREVELSKAKARRTQVETSSTSQFTKIEETHPLRRAAVLLKTN